MLRQIYAIMVGSKTLNVKTTCRKSCPANILQVSNLILDSCFMVQVSHYIEKAFYLILIIAPWALNPFLLSDYRNFCLLTVRDKCCSGGRLVLTIILTG